MFSLNFLTKQSEDTKLITDQRAHNRRLAFNGLIVIVMLIGATLSMLPIFISGIPNGPDLRSHLRFVSAFNESIQEGNIYPAWQHQANNGYGDGSFRIYSPLVYYVIFVIDTVVKDRFSALKLLFLFLALTGACAIYYWVIAFGNKTQSVLAALIYCFAPFRLNELHQSAMISQFAGAPLLALLLGITERMSEEGVSRKSLLRIQALFALTSGALVFTHIPLAMMAMMIIPLYAILRFGRQIRWRRLFDLALAGFVGMLLSAFYWVNLVCELPLLKGATIQPGVRFDYRANFAFAINSSSISTWYANLLFIVTLMLLIPTFLVLVFSRHQRQHRTLIVIAVPTIFTFFMVTPLSTPMWMVVPKLSSMEFPWRWLSASSILTSGLAGFSLPLLWKELLIMRLEKKTTSVSDEAMKTASKNESLSRLWLVLGLGCTIITISFSLAYPFRNPLFYDRIDFTTMSELSKSSSGLEEWLPRWTSVESLEKLIAEKSPEISVTGREVSIQSWLSEDRRFTVGDGNEAVARVRTFFYPYWQLRTANNVPLVTRPDNDGVLLVDIPAGQQTVEMKFVRPFHQTLGNILSVVGVLCLLSLSIFYFERKNGTPVA